MMRILRWVSRIVLVLLVLVALLVGYVYVASARLLARTYTTDTNLPQVTLRSDPDSIARGKYLVDRGACRECHDKDLGGKLIEDSFAMGRLASANLTRGRGGLGATYADRDFVRAIVHGVKRDGHTLVYMPSADYQFTEADLGAVLGYLRSLPPVDREQPPAQIGPIARALGLFTDFPLTPAAHIDHATVHLAMPPSGSDAAAAGAYVVASAGCRGCHGVDLRGGGGPPPGAGNITPVGIGTWNERDFVSAIRDHKRPNGSAIDEAMPRVYGQMSDDDLRAVFAFLKTVPPAGEKSANQKKGD